MVYVGKGKVKATLYKARYGLHLQWGFVMAIAEHAGMEVTSIDHDPITTFLELEKRVGENYELHKRYKQYLIKNSIPASVANWVEFYTTKLLQ